MGEENEHIFYDHTATAFAIFKSLCSFSYFSRHTVVYYIIENRFPSHKEHKENSGSRMRRIYCWAYLVVTDHLTCSFDHVKFLP